MNQIVLITGADRGLGYALTEIFLRRKATVVAGRFLSHSEQLDKLKAIYGNQLQLVELDISSIESVKKAAETFGANFNHLDILINNAAVLGDIEKTIFDTLDYEDISNTFQVNTLGPLRMINVFIPYLLRSDKKLIINISSEAGSIGECTRTNWFGYTMSKCALNMQSTLLQNQLREQGVRILLFHPGWMRTMMNGKLDEKAPTLPEEAAERILSRIEHLQNYTMDKPPYIDNDTGRMLSW